MFTSCWPTQRRLELSPTLVAALGFLLLGIIRAWFSTYPIAGILEMALLGQVALAILSIAVVSPPPENDEHRPWTLLALEFGCGSFVALYIVRAAICLATGISLPSFEWFSPFQNQRIFAHTLTWTIPLIPIVFFHAKQNSPFVRALTFGGCAIWISLLWTNGARGAVLGCGLGIVTTALVMRKALSIQLLAQATLLFLASIAIAYFHARVLASSVPSGAALLRSGSSGRLEMWHGAFSLVRQHWILGIGPMQYSLSSDVPFASLHSWFTSILVEFGITGLLLILAIIGFTARSIFFYLRAQSANPLMVVCLSSSLSAALVHGLFSGVFTTPASLLIGSLVCGTLASHLLGSAPDSEEVNFQTDRRNAPELVAIAVGATLFFVVSAHLTIILRPCRNFQTYKIEGPVSPRYWQEGRLSRSAVCERLLR